MNNKILKEQILALLADQDDSAVLESVYALLTHPLEKPKGTKPQKQLVLTDRQQECINRAIKAKLIARQPDGTLHWLHHSKVLLAYFCGRVFSGDSTRTGVNGASEWRPGAGRFPAAALERLFNTRLIKHYREQRLRCALPKGHEQVDEILLI